MRNFRTQGIKQQQIPGISSCIIHTEVSAGLHSNLATPMGIWGRRERGRG